MKSCPYLVLLLLLIPSIQSAERTELQIAESIGSYTGIIDAKAEACIGLQYMPPPKSSQREYRYYHNFYAITIKQAFFRLDNLRKIYTETNNPKINTFDQQRTNSFL